jgi:serine/threonine-protein kinase
MPLAPGTRLGSYEILSSVGAGGMGEVYRARDTQLKRDVAVKVLAESVAGDSDRLARFRREAQVLASVNHPNIAGIYGSESGALVLESVWRADGRELFYAEPVALESGQLQPAAADIRMMAVAVSRSLLRPSDHLGRCSRDGTA